MSLNPQFRPKAVEARTSKWADTTDQRPPTITRVFPVGYQMFLFNSPRDTLQFISPRGGSHTAKIRRGQEHPAIQSRTYEPRGSECGTTSFRNANQWFLVRPLRSACASSHRGTEIHPRTMGCSPWCSATLEPLSRSRLCDHVFQPTSIPRGLQKSRI